MHQKQRMIPKRAGAEDEDVLDIFFWAYGEEPCDCHPGDGELLKRKNEVQDSGL